MLIHANINVHFHFGSGQQVEKEFEVMSDKLDAAIAAATQNAQEESNELDAILNFIQSSVPQITAAAVSDALAANGVAEDQAIAAVTAAEQSVRTKIDGVLAATQAGATTVVTTAPADATTSALAEATPTDQLGTDQSGATGGAPAV